MSEHVRQSYLSDLGVTVWTSTVTLENALATPEDMLSQHLTNPTEIQPAALTNKKAADKVDIGGATDNASSASRAKLKDQFANLGQEVRPSKVAPDKPEVSNEATANTATEKVPRFRLRMMAVSEQLILVDDISEQAPGFTRFHRQLISQLLYSLKLPSHASYDVQEVHWPLVPDAKIDQSSSEASKAVAMKLRLLASKHKIKSILLCGDQSSKWARDTKFQGLSIGAGFEDEHGLKFVTSHGLDRIMQTPSLKKQFWAHVRHLRG